MSRGHGEQDVAAAPYDRSVLVRQFALTKRLDALPRGWRCESLRNWRLATPNDAGLPILPVNIGHEQIGWLVGYPVDSIAGLLRESWTLPDLSNSVRFEVELEEAIYSLGGRFAAVILLEDLERLYLDPLGSLATVFSARHQMAGSTTSVLPPENRRDPSRLERDHADLRKALAIPEKDHWYPFGLTSRRDAQRLLPNHYLDLATWETHRHWPKPEDLPRTSDPARAADSVSSRLNTLLEHLTTCGSVTMDLTGGRDSRMLLACARPLVDRLDFVTIDFRDRTGRIDRKLVKKLVRRFGLTHRMIPWREATSEELDLWLYRTGYAVAGRTWKAVRTIRMKGADGFTLPGHAGEIGRAFYWREGDLQRDTAPAEELIERLHLPVVEPIVTRAEMWLEGLPVVGLPTVLDLLYLELRVGCWASLHAYGHVDEVSIIPLNHRRTIEDLLSLPPEFRWHEKLPEAVISGCWPELLDVPFNRFMGTDRIVDACVAPVRRFARNRPRIGRWLPLGEFR